MDPSRRTAKEASPNERMLETQRIERVRRITLNQRTVILIAGGLIVLAVSAIAVAIWALGHRGG